MQGTYVYNDSTPPPMAYRRSLNGMNEDAFEHSGYDSVYGTPLGYSFAPHEIDLPETSQGNWQTPHSSQHRSETLRSSPETPLDDTPGSMQEKNLLTPGNDVESNQSFHTAAGEMNMAVTPPFASDNINLADCHDIGISNREDDYVKLRNASKHEYDKIARANIVQC